jgi:hypothetical protein
MRFVFDNPYYVAPPAPDPVERLVATGGNWQGSYDYYYLETTPEGRFLYGLVDEGSENTTSDGDDRYIEYDPSDRKFHDIGSGPPNTWATDDTGTNLSDFPTQSNMPIHYWYKDTGVFKFQFDNPYYVA